MAADSDELADLITLNQIGETLNRAVDVRGALNATLPRLVELMGLDAGWIFLKDPNNQDRWAGRGYKLAAHYNLPPALDLESKAAWEGGCDCQGLCNKGKLTEAYNEVRCSRLAEASGEKHGLTVHASTPLRAGNEVLGILNVAGPDWSDFDGRALALLTNVGNQMGSALERARLYDLLTERRILEQQALLELSNHLLGSTDMEETIRFLVEEVRRLLQADAAAVIMPDEQEPGVLRFRAASGWYNDPVAAGRRFPHDSHYSGSGRVMATQQPFVVADGSQLDIPAWQIDWLRAEAFQGAAMVPLIAGGRSIGTLVVDSRQPRRFDENEIRFLQLMANQAAIAIEKARLLDEEIKRQRLEEELEVGREIQLSFLPDGCPVIPGWQLCAIYQAAHQVGGDFYDFFDVPGEAHKLGMVIADVADKGVPAALFMALGRTLIRSTGLSGRTPAAALTRANELILKDTQTDLFLSAFYGVLETGSGRLSYANAGHNRPIWWRANQSRCEELAAHGIVLGILEDIELEEREIQVTPGDFLVFYTDGVNEAVNRDEEEFGMERLQAIIAASSQGTADQILWAIVDAVNQFTANAPQYDDFTLFVVKRQ
jgi:serine phosphatase RsbU (regulator of sigma subunit)